MAPKKPASLLVFGILNLVFGGLNLLTYLCCTVVGVGFYGLMRKLYDDAPPEAQRELDEVWRAFDDNVPGLLITLVVLMILSLVLALMQFISGIGLVRIRNWGRWLCIAWGALEILAVSGSLFYEIAILTPGMNKAVEDLDKWAKRVEERDRKMGRPTGQRPQFQQMGTGNPIVDNALSIGLSGLNVIYAGVAMIFMVLPQTGQAIRRYYAPPEEMSATQAADYYDEDYERRRRLEEPPPEGGLPPPPNGLGPPTA